MTVAASGKARAWTWPKRPPFRERRPFSAMVSDWGDSPDSRQIQSSDDDYFTIPFDMRFSTLYSMCVPSSMGVLYLYGSYRRHALQ